MTIHVVRSGETVDSIAAGYGVAPSRLAADNELPPDFALAVGQTLVVRFPREVHAVSAGETLTSIAARYGTTVRQLWRNNWELGGREELAAGQALVISYFDERLGQGLFNGYAYPFISQELLEAELPYPTSPPWPPLPTASRRRAGSCPWRTGPCWPRPGSGGPGR